MKDVVSRVQRVWAAESAARGTGFFPFRVRLPRAEGRVGSFLSLCTCYFRVVHCGMKAWRTFLIYVCAV